MILAGGRLGAPGILGSMQGRAEGDVSREQALAWLADAVGELSDLAGELGQWLSGQQDHRVAAKARALLQGRLAVTREDIRALAKPVLRHRLLLSFAAEAEGRSTDWVVEGVLDAVAP